jgi:hypothetical protein
MSWTIALQASSGLPRRFWVMNEHAMLDAVPLAGAGRVMGDADRQAGFGGELLQLDLPEAEAGAVAAAAVGGDEQAPGSGMALAAHAKPRAVPIVLRAIPVVWLTALMPPRPAARASLAANRRNTSGLNS